MKFLESRTSVSEADKKKADELASAGKTPLAFLKGSRFLGFIAVADAIREDSPTAIKRLQSMGIHVVMLTGDNERSAKAIGIEAGVDEVIAGVLPDGKEAVIRDLKKKGKVAMVGDGINDAPVLAGADVGAAMGSGADAAIEAADVVFMKADLSSIPASVRIARSANIVSKENIIFALAVKLLVMVLGLTNHASMWLAVFADTGVAILCVLNSIRILYKK